MAKAKKAKPVEYFTLTEIVAKTEIPKVRIRYILETRNIYPAKVVASAYLYTAEQVKAIQAEYKNRGPYKRRTAGVESQ